MHKLVTGEQKEEEVCDPYIKKVCTSWIKKSSQVHPKENDRKSLVEVEKMKSQNVGNVGTHIPNFNLAFSRL